jgi:hypothetical protein
MKNTFIEKSEKNKKRREGGVFIKHKLNLRYIRNKCDNI